MPYYRQVLLVNPRAPGKEISAMFKSCASAIVNQHGIFRGYEHRGIQELGYPIEDRRSGKLVRYGLGRLLVAHFNTSTPVLAEIDQILKLNETVLRFNNFKTKDPLADYLHTRVDPKKIYKLHQKQGVFPLSSLTTAKRHKMLDRYTFERPSEERQQYDQLVEKEFQKVYPDFHTQKQSHDIETADATPHWQRDFYHGK